ncbi:hypothetical protein BDF19DRAFT_99326 [Syncephalis fuscata]|nr:hypothetical protein BDF19DRAFT_99326 [Syncephalis fuscata]
MPAIQSNPNIISGWKSNATYFGSIPLHRLGELDIMNYVMEDTTDINQVRTRLIGFYSQLVLDIFMCSLFITTWIRAIKLIADNPRSVSSWVCMLPSLMGVGFMLVLILLFSSVGVNCRMVLWYANFCFWISATCTNLIVLQKAYFVLCRKRWVLVVGIGFMSPQLGYIYSALSTSIITIDPKLGCVFNYSSFLPYYWFGTEMPVNFFFSIIFSHVAYKQYCMFGSEAWKQLARDGIQTMVLAVLCNILCIIIILLEIGGVYSQLYFVLNWIITSTIIVNHCRNMRRMVKLSHRPKTEYYLHISHIDTAK